MGVLFAKNTWMNHKLCRGCKKGIKLPMYWWDFGCSPVISVFWWSPDAAGATYFGCGGKVRMWMLHPEYSRTSGGRSSITLDEGLTGMHQEPSESA